MPFSLFLMEENSLNLDPKGTFFYFLIIQDWFLLPLEMARKEKENSSIGYLLVLQ